MRLFFTSIITVVLFFNVSGNTTQNAGLGEIFLKSLKENKFDLLKGFLPTVEFYKSIPEASKKSDTEIKNILNQSNERLKKSWQTIADGLKNRKVDVANIVITETLIFNPFPSRNEMEGMAVVYKHEGKSWDDLNFIISRWKGKIFLLEIPNPTRAFTFYDETLKASNQARTSIEMKKAEFRKSLEEKVKNIISLVNENNLQGFAGNLMYRGEDESRKWKSPLNSNDSTENQQATDFMKRVKLSLSDCNDYKTGDVRTEKESEGTWIVLPIKCGTKTVSFAFLRINDKFLLGDIDSETN